LVSFSINPGAYWVSVKFIFLAKLFMAEVSNASLFSVSSPFLSLKKSFILD